MRIFHFPYPCLLLGLAAALSGCGSNRFVDEDRLAESPVQSHRVKAFVNSDTPEAGVLRRSGLYEITNRDSAEAVISCLSVRYDERMTCGNPFIFFGLTLGVIPYSVKGEYEFSYNILINGDLRAVHHTIPAYRRFSIWEHVLSPDGDEALARGLAHTRAKAGYLSIQSELGDDETARRVISSFDKKAAP